MVDNMTYGVGVNHGQGVSPWHYDYANLQCTAEHPEGEDLYSTPYDILPPVDSDSIAAAPQKIINSSELKELSKNKIDYKVLEVWFFPKNGMTAEKIMQISSITDPALVHQVATPEEAQVRIEFTSNIFLTRQDHPDFNSSTLSPEELAKQQLTLQVAGLSSLADLEKGSVTARFTTDDSGQNIKHFVVYWISDDPANGVSVQVIAHKLNDEAPWFAGEEAADAKTYISALQELLKLHGYLPSKKEANGNVDKGTVMNSYMYLLSDPTLYQPDKDETLERMADLENKAEKLKEEFLAVLADKTMDKEVKGLILTEMGQEGLGLYTQLRDLSKGSLDTFTDEIKDDAIRTEAERLLALSEKRIGKLLEVLIGIEKQNGSRLIYTNDFNNAEKQLEKYFKAKTNTDAEKLEAKSLYNNALNSYKATYATLRQYEKQYGWLPGVEQRCEELRQELLSKLEEKQAAWAKKHGEEKVNETITGITNSLTHLETTYSAEPSQKSLEMLYEVSDKFVAKEANGQDTFTANELNTIYGKAGQISDTILADSGEAIPTRMLVISFFNMVLSSDEKVPLNELFAKFNELINTCSEKELQDLGKYYWTQSLYAQQGKEYKKTPPAAAKKIEKICKGDDGQPITKLQEALGNLAYAFYREQYVHNTWAKANGKKTITFADMNTIGQEIVSTLPTSRRKAKKVFSVLSTLSESPKLAKKELSQKLEGELMKLENNDHFASQLKAEQFDKKAQTLTLNSRYIGTLSAEAGKGIQLAHSDNIQANLAKALEALPEDAEPELRAFYELSLYNIELKEPGYYYYAEVETSDCLGTELAYYPALTPEHAPLSLSTVGGKQFEREIADFQTKNGAGLINVALMGKTSSTGYLETATNGVIIDALDYDGMAGLIIAASQGDYELRQGTGLNALHYEVLNKVQENVPDVLDLRQHFTKHENPESLYYKIDGHWNRKGMKIAGELILEYINKESTNDRIAGE